MKVKLAVQLLSESVADALDFCRVELKLKQFEKSEATAEFLRVFNDAFDVLNSRKWSDFGYEKALCTENIDELDKFIENSICYIKSMRMLDGTHLISSQVVSLELLHVWPTLKFYIKDLLIQKC